MERGAKANVVACAWGAEFVKFLAALEIEEMLPPQTDLCLCFSLHPLLRKIMTLLIKGGCKINVCVFYQSARELDNKLWIQAWLFLPVFLIRTVCFCPDPDQTSENFILAPGF